MAPMNANASTRPIQYSTAPMTSARTPARCSTATPREVAIARYARESGVGDDEQRGEHGDLHVEDLAGDDAALLLDVEDVGEHAAQRPEQPRGEPDEADGAEHADAAARADGVRDDAVDQVSARDARLPGSSRSSRCRHRLVDDCRRLVQQVREPRDEQQHERHGGQQDVERDPAGEEEDVVLAGVVPDALRVVAERPSRAARAPAGAPGGACGAGRRSIDPAEAPDAVGPSLRRRRRGRSHPRPPPRPLAPSRGLPRARRRAPRGATRRAGLVGRLRLGDAALEILTRVVRRGRDRRRSRDAPGGA